MTARGRIALGLAAPVFLGVAIRHCTGTRPLPPPAPVAAESEPSPADFVGAAACAECHVDQYQAWLGSTHGRAGGPPSPETAIAPFDGAPIRFRDAVVVPHVDSVGQYVFSVRLDNGRSTEFPVMGFVGGGHMVGGGTQGSVSIFPDGTIRFLPFDYARAEAVWFCAAEGPAGEDTRGQGHFVPITEDLSIEDCHDWPPSRVLGADAPMSNCQQCHGSQILIRYNPEGEAYETRIHSLAINCESCHGPGRRHAELAHAGMLEDSVDIAIAALGTVDKDASLQVCFQCHALKGGLAPAYLPGNSFLEHFSLKIWMIGQQAYEPDGRIRTFGYQQNHLYSDCYLNGSMTCVDCHDPHSQQYRDVFGNVLDGRFSDGQCVGCHASKASDISRHTHHAPGSPGSRCVACHMPYLQQRAVGTAIRYARSDHTIPIPRPLHDRGLGLEAACEQCHRDRDVEDLDASVRAWYGELKPLKEIVQALVLAESGAIRPDLLLDPAANHPQAQAYALVRVLKGHLRPDMPEREPQTIAMLRELMRHRDLDVRALAAASLHYAWGGERDVRRFLIGELQRLGDQDVLVRRRWASALALVAGQLADIRAGAGSAPDAAAVQASIRTYQKAIEAYPDDPHILSDLARRYSYVGDHEAAVEYFGRSLAVDPNQPLVRLDLRVAEANLRKSEESP